MVLEDLRDRWNVFKIPMRTLFNQYAVPVLMRFSKILAGCALGGYLLGHALPFTKSDFYEIPLIASIAKTHIEEMILDDPEAFRYASSKQPALDLLQRLGDDMHVMQIDVDSDGIQDIIFINRAYHGNGIFFPGYETPEGKGYRRIDEEPRFNHPDARKWINDRIDFLVGE
jgi:hypothetical protein